MENTSAKLLTLLLVKLATLSCFSKLFTLYPGGTIICLNLCIKFGDSVPLAEAHTLRFIAKHTSTPLPKVHHAFIHCSKTYILMERIRGETVAKRWHSLSDTSKASIFSQLRGMIEEPRSIPARTPGISNVDGGPLQACRLPHKSSWGPFNTVSDFHSALRNNITSRALEAQIDGSLNPTAISDLQKLVAFHESVTHPPVLTHGDLSTFNILLNGSEVVAILDWGTSGWLPYYWEYSMARYANPLNAWWQHEVDNFLPPHTAEFEMERVRRIYFGE